MNRCRLLGMVVAGGLLAACGKDPEFAEQPTPSASAPPPPPPSAVAPVASAPPPATATPCDGTQSLALSGMLQVRAGTEAPKMEPVGGLACATVGEGQSASSPVTMLEPGHCYTVVAQGLPNVTEVDVQLVADPTGGAATSPQLAALLGKPTLAVDTDSGVTATIGAKQNCYQWPFPIGVMAKVEVKARTGSGPVAAQLYKKKKSP